MQDDREPFTAVIKSLKLEQRLALVRPYQYQAVLERIIAARTCLGRDALKAYWWWESLRGPVASIEIEPGFAADTLRRLIPGDEQVWFVAEASEKAQDNFWIYEGDFGAVCALLPEMPLFEYYLVSRKMDWLVCENHHNRLMVSGEEMVGKAERIGFRRG